MLLCMKTLNTTVKTGSAVPPDPKAAEEAKKDTVSREGGFKNDPDEPTNPNEAIERSRRTLRPTPLPKTTGGHR
jgi:hypothetical protein